MLDEFKRTSQGELERKYRGLFEACGDDRSFDRSFIKNVLGHLSDVLMDTEQVLAMSSGVSDDGRCLMVLTNKRVLLLTKGVLFGFKHVAIAIEKISAVSGKVGAFKGFISITAGPTIRQIHRVPKKAVMPFANKVEEVIQRRSTASEG